MIVLDLNILISAMRPDNALYGVARSWLDGALKSEEQLGVADVVLIGFIRITTNPRAYADPTPMTVAVAQLKGLLAQPIVRRVVPAEGHFEVLSRLLQLPGIRGNLVTDAYIAALAIERGARVVTFDRDFSRFPGLQVVDPRVAGTAGS